MILVCELDFSGDAHEFCCKVLAVAVLHLFFVVFSLVETCQLHTLDVPACLFGKVLTKVDLCIVKVAQVFSGKYIEEFTIEAVVMFAHIVRRVEVALQRLHVLVVDVLHLGLLVADVTLLVRLKVPQK